MSKPQTPDTEKTPDKVETNPQVLPEIEPQPLENNRQGRRFVISNQRGKATGKIRYVETNDPKKGCRFL